MSTLPTITGLGVLASAFASGCGVVYSIGGIPPISHQNGGTDTQLMLRQWHHLYSIGAATMPPLALIATGLHAYASYTSYSSSSSSSTTRWAGSAAGAVLTLAIVPFTFTVIFPVNRRLEDAMDDDVKGKKKKEKTMLSVEEIRVTLEQWKVLNLVRASLPLLGAAAGFWALMEMFA